MSDEKKEMNPTTAAGNLPGLFKAVMDLTRDAVLVFNESGAIKFANAEASRAFQYPQGDLEGLLVKVRFLFNFV